MDRNKNSIVIKEVNVTTIDDFLGLIDKLAEYEKLDPPNEEAKERLRTDCLSNKPRYKTYIGKVGNKTVSYFIFFFTYSSFLALPTLFLEDIFVLNEYRLQGIGKTMFDFIKEIAKREGCGRIEFTVLNWNKLAQEFYEKNGAHCLEDWFFYRITKVDF